MIRLIFLPVDSYFDKISFSFADHSLFINCGGNQITHEGNNYEADLSTKGASTFASTENRWAYSSSGVFISNNEDAKYIATNQYDASGAEY